MSECSECLRWQSDLAHEVLETRIGTNVVPARVPLEPHEPVRALPDGGVQVREHLFAIAETSVDGCDGIRRRVTALPLQFVELCEDISRFLRLARFRVQIA